MKRNLRILTKRERKLTLNEIVESLYDEEEADICIMANHQYDEVTYYFSYHDLFSHL